MLFLGIDGGGSTCRARIRDGQGALCGEATGAASNLYQDFDGAIATITATANEAARMAHVSVSDLHAGLGLAGVVTSVGIDKIAKAGLPFASVTVDNDAVAACIGAFGGGNGGVVIAGTGSIGLAIVDGRRHMVGGWGFQLGDHGSGAWLGHHAARRAALALDGLLQPTPLIEAVLERCGRNRPELSSWAEKATPKDYAALAPLVFEHAAHLDMQAMSIVSEGASAVSKLGQSLLAHGVAQLCFLGGLSQPYWQHLDKEVRASLVTPLADATDGAIMMARRSQLLSEKW